MTQWEYKRVTARGDDDVLLAEMGQQGWELVLTIRADYVFKRPVTTSLIRHAQDAKKLDSSPSQRRTLGLNGPKS